MLMTKLNEFTWDVGKWMTRPMVHDGITFFVFLHLVDFINLMGKRLYGAKYGVYVYYVSPDSVSVEMLAYIAKQKKKKISSDKMEQAKWLADYGIGYCCYFELGNNYTRMYNRARCEIDMIVNNPFQYMNTRPDGHAWSSVVSGYTDGSKYWVPRPEVSVRGIWQGLKLKLNPNRK